MHLNLTFNLFSFFSIYIDGYFLILFTSLVFLENKTGDEKTARGAGCQVKIKFKMFLRKEKTIYCWFFPLLALFPFWGGWGLINIINLLQNVVCQAWWCMDGEKNTCLAPKSRRYLICFSKIFVMIQLVWVHICP